MKHRSTPGKVVAGNGGSGQHGQRVRPGWVVPVDFDKANARPGQLIDNDVESSCGYCRSFKINNHPILVVLSRESLALFEEHRVDLS